jgi:hypothetical protein
MQHSEKIDELATALAKAQAVMTGALKDSANPFFKSRYADLESVWTACRKALTEHGLSVVQSASATEGGVAVTTMLLHSSGQWMRDTLPLNPKDMSPQGIGSAITYGRRYGLAAIAGVYQTDDDAEAAHGRGKQQEPQVSETEAKLLASNFKAALKTGIDGRVFDIHQQANADQELYSAAWSFLSAPERREIKAAIERVKVPNTNRAAREPAEA